MSGAKLRLMEGRQPSTYVECEVVMLGGARAYVPKARTLVGPVGLTVLDEQGRDKRFIPWSSIEMLNFSEKELPASTRQSNGS